MSRPRKFAAVDTGVLSRLMLGKVSQEVDGARSAVSLILQFVSMHKYAHRNFCLSSPYFFLRLELCERTTVDNILSAQERICLRASAANTCLISASDHPLDTALCATSLIVMDVLQLVGGDAAMTAAPSVISSARGLYLEPLRPRA